MIKVAASVNHHLENLKQQLSHSERANLDYVVIAHSDHHMINKLKHAFVDCSIALVTIPQNCWMMQDTEVEEMMDWIVNDLNALGVILVGHSQGGTPEDQVQVCEPGQVDSIPSAPVNRIHSVFERVQIAQSQMKENERHFLCELQRLETAIACQVDGVAQPARVRGLFYRAESGVFCLYHSASGQFQPLV